MFFVQDNVYKPTVKSSDDVFKQTFKSCIDQIIPLVTDLKFNELQLIKKQPRTMSTQKIKYSHFALVQKFNNCPDWQCTDQKTGHAVFKHKLTGKSVCLSRHNKDDLCKAGKKQLHDILQEHLNILNNHIFKFDDYSKYVPTGKPGKFLKIRTQWKACPDSKRSKENFKTWQEDNKPGSPEPSRPMIGFAARQGS